MPTYLMCMACREKSEGREGTVNWQELMSRGWYAVGEHVYCPEHRRVFRPRKRERRADRQRAAP